MNIARIAFPRYPLFLAPMEDVTDLTFRKLCKRFGADMVTTEFVSCDALVRHVDKTCRKLEIDDRERPVAIQIYGRDPSAMADAAQICAEAKPDIIDINFGCPVKKVAGKGAGSGMLRTPDLLLAITRSVVNAVKIPVTVKTRLGWDSDSKIIVTLARQLQDEGIAALTIHGRTRAQMFTGVADWELIKQVKHNPGIYIPIIGNGDLDSPQVCRQRLDETDVDALMIGRAAIGSPWIFEQVKSFLQTGEPEARGGFAQYMEVLKELVTENINCRGEKGGIIHSRRHLANTSLLKGIPNFKKTRVEMLRADTREKLFAILDCIVREVTAVTETEIRE